MNIDEIKKALRICANDTENCYDDNCPYRYDNKCMPHSARDALEAIELLEERIAIMEEGGETIVWHKWPDEKPQEYAPLLGHLADIDKSMPQVRECYMVYTGAFLFPTLIEDRFHKITEWAYMPTGTSKKDGK